MDRDKTETQAIGLLDEARMQIKDAFRKAEIAQQELSIRGLNEDERQALIDFINATGQASVKGYELNKHLKRPR